MIKQLIYTSIILWIVSIEAPIQRLSDNKFETSTDTLQNFMFTSKTVKTCSKSKCLESTKKEIYNLQSCLLVYRGKSSWIMEKDSASIIRILDQYPIKELSIATGNVKINDKQIAEDHLIVLSDIN